MNKKRIAYVILSLIIIIISVVAYWSIQYPIYHRGIATITATKGYKAVYAKIDDIDAEVIINSAIFKVGDEVKVEYYKQKGVYQISKLEAIIDTDEDKKQMVKNLDKDYKLHEYQDMINCQISFEDNFYNCVDCKVIPVKISGQTYFNMVTPEEYFKYLIAPPLPILENEQIIIDFSNEFEILKFQNVNNNNYEDISYEIDNSNIVLNSIGQGIYVLEIMFKNGDIVKYLFT